MPARRDPDRSALTLFADELHATREKAGMSREDLAAKLNYSASLVAMVEGLRRVPQADFAARCDAALDTPGTFARLQKRLRELPFTESFRPFAAYEEAATSLRNFEHTLVPGLLQTPDYVQAILSSHPNTNEEDLDDRVTSRLSRQAILNRDNPPTLWAVMDEAVLHREVGAPKVMYDQLMHLADRSDRPNITLQVIPYSSGAHAGLQGAFVIADLDNAPSVVFLATATEGQTLEELSRVAKVAFLFDTLRSEALPRKASRDMIVRIAEEEWIR
jgi:transcriptional regulator with XRE-family HTH domain